MCDTLHLNVFLRVSEAFSANFNKISGQERKHCHQLRLQYSEGANWNLLSDAIKEPFFFH